MKIAIFGTGYVGLVSGACFAEVGNTVTCVDIDQAKIDGLLQGVIPIYEPGLEDLVVSNHAAGRLLFTTDADAALREAEVVFIAVGTPPDEDGSADLRHVLAVARTIGRHVERPTVVVDKSTVPVGRHYRAKPHAHRRELPEVRHQPRVRIAGEPGMLLQLAAEVL